MNQQRIHTPRDAQNSPQSAPMKGRDEQLKARALQRWENEGGKVQRPREAVARKIHVK